MSNTYNGWVQINADGWNLGDISNIFDVTTGSQLFTGATMGVILDPAQTIVCTITVSMSVGTASASFDSSPGITWGGPSFSQPSTLGQVSSGTFSNSGTAPTGSATWTASVTPSPGASGVITFTFTAQGAPLCWKLTCLREDGRLFEMSGPGRFPSEIEVPSDCDPSTSILHEDGLFIDPRHYKLIPKR